jgi:Hemerythrin HHE cation binding domain
MDSAFIPAAAAATNAAMSRSHGPRKANLRSVPRHDLHGKVHAGLRACMCEALTAAARMDPDDPADIAGIVMRMHELVALCSSHLANEDAFVHPAMEARRPGSTARVAHDHAEQVAGFAVLTRDVDALRRSSAHVRADAAATLGRDLAAFVAANLVHMAAEERDHNAVLWATHTDDELRAIEASIVASIPPSKVPAHLRWMVPALPPHDRLAMMRKLRAFAPPALFDASLAAIEPYLRDREWMKLVEGLSAA